MKSKRLNELREEVKKKEVKSLLIGFLITLILFLIIKFYSVIIAGAIFSLVFSKVSTSKLRMEYSKEFKKTYVEDALKSHFDDLVYMPDKGLDESVLTSTGVIYTGDRYHSNDLIYAKYKDVNFVLSDVTIKVEEEETDSDGHTHTYYRTIFCGSWMIFDFNKQFRDNVIATQSRAVISLRKNIFSKSSYEKVEMEDEIFNKRFIVYSDNPHEAFYILTPQVIEKMKELDNKIDGSLYFAFINNKLYIGVDSGTDSFEAPSVYSKTTDEEIENKLNNEISLITMFVDTLELDNDIFRKVV